jgi:peptidoglycan/LPS O-acetylase OafA/YrhL
MERGQDVKRLSPQTRIVFFDNLRTLVVLLVLVFHAGASYGSIVAFWPYHDPNPSALIDHTLPLIDVFMMSILFFISGYFCLASLQRNGGWRFLARKLKRLGLPWLVVVVLVLPVLDYVHYYVQAVDRGRAPRGYGAHWWLSMKTLAGFSTGPMKMSAYLDMTEHFYQRYVWYLSLLLLFYVLFWLLYTAWKRWRPASNPSVQEETPSNRPVYRALAWIGLLSILLFALAKFLVSSPADPFDFAWFSLGNLVQFEIAKLAFYIPYFGLGVYAYANKWFTAGRDMGRPWVWAAVCFVLMVFNMLVGRSMTRAAEPSMVLQLAFAMLYPLWTLSFLGLFVAFASRRWNTAQAAGRELASNSYTMYLVHYVFVMTLPLSLSAWAAPTLVKFGIVALAVILLSFGASKYIVRPYPRLVLIGLVGLNALLAVIA